MKATIAAADPSTPTVVREAMALAARELADRLRVLREERDRKPENVVELGARRRGGRS